MVDKLEVLHSRVLGSGAENLIILHGYFGMGDNWKTLGTQFSERFTVHLVDQRNHGRSFHSDEFNYDLMVDDLIQYMDFYKIDKAHFIGHSMGGKTLMNFAVKYPQRTLSAIIADIGPKFYPPHHGIILDAINGVDFRGLNSRGEVESQLTPHIKEFGVRQFLMKTVYRKDKENFAFRFNIKSLTENNPEVGKALELGALYNGPTMFIRGGRSDYILNGDLNLIQAHFPHAVLEEIKGAGHWLHAENPKLFFEICTRFWDGLI